jgi:predicted double-glycine peptidase
LTYAFRVVTVLDVEKTSPSRTLIELLLVERGTSLEGYVSALRDKGLGWRLIARQLHTDHGVDVTWMSLYRWFRDDESSAA